MCSLSVSPHSSVVENQQPEGGDNEMVLVCTEPLCHWGAKKHYRHSAALTYFLNVLLLSCISCCPFEMKICACTWTYNASPIKKAVLNMMMRSRSLSSNFHLICTLYTYLFFVNANIIWAGTWACGCSLSWAWVIVYAAGCTIRAAALLPPQHGLFASLNMI